MVFYLQKREIKNTFPFFNKNFKYIYLKNNHEKLQD